MLNRVFVWRRTFEGSRSSDHGSASLLSPAAAAQLQLQRRNQDNNSYSTLTIQSQLTTHRTSASAIARGFTSSKEASTTNLTTESRVYRRISEPAAITVKMAASHSPEADLQSTIKQLHQCLSSQNYAQAAPLLSKAKISLLRLNALVPAATTPPQSLALAREVLELGALISIRQKEPSAFVRYFFQLQPFYALPSSHLPPSGGNASKITGLYLLLLLSQGDYAAFHTLLETLESAAGLSGGKSLEEDEFIQYPVRLERALMEGSYDRVWGETKRKRLPGDEFAVFSEVLVDTIRSEIASCSEKAYPSIPISNAKNLFLLDSEGAVVSFAQQRDWLVKDGRIYFPQQESDLLASEKDILSTSDTVIENTLGYARELEMIV